MREQELEGGFDGSVNVGFIYLACQCLIRLFSIFFNLAINFFVG